MDDSSATAYLKQYIQQSSSLVEHYIQSQQKQAQQLGDLPAQLLDRFFLMLTLGKRMRGALVTLGYEVAGGLEEKKILDTSLFVELFQTAALIHDDIMDEDDMRRGVESFHKYFSKDSKHFGESLAICAGDIGYFLAMQHLAQSAFPPEIVTRAMNIFTNYIVRVGFGQTLDVASSDSLNEKDILTIYQLKTAEYSGAMPLLVGATIAGCTDEKKLDAIKTYGLALGWAFQIQDDLLGMFGEEQATGKPVGSDIREGKQTLLMLHLKEHGTKAQKQFQKKILGNKNITKNEITKMQNILHESGSYEYIRNLCTTSVEQGKKVVSGITENGEHYKLLDSFLEFAAGRNH